MKRRDARTSPLGSVRTRAATEFGVTVWVPTIQLLARRSSDSWTVTSLA